ncbi:hypothetical protein [Streptomyces sp. KLOTTS4A1]|uniref:hypothetical protein n=1 Tax=Streptomyces sp. KLOTTS4A1 TaxID=3390996 RepID=UPI0039F5DA3B
MTSKDLNTGLTDLDVSVRLTILEYGTVLAEYEAAGRPDAPAGVRRNYLLAREVLELAHLAPAGEVASLLTVGVQALRRVRLGLLP